MPPKKTKAGSSSQKRENVEVESEESSPVPKFRRVSSQSSNLAKIFHELVELGTNRCELPSSATKYKTKDLESLKVTFKRAPAKNAVVPDVQDNDQFQANFRKSHNYVNYVLPTINTKILGNTQFDVTTFDEITNNKARTFFTKLHRVVRKGVDVVGTNKSFTDTLIDDLLRITELNNFPLMIKNHPRNRLYIQGDAIVSSDPEFVVEGGNLSILVIDDRHLGDVSSATGFGESQIAVEMLACGSENLRSLGRSEPGDQTILAMRVITTYVTFYKTVITSAYWKELESGLPKDKSVKIQRWPVKNSLEAGLNLAEPNGRKQVLMALAKIRELLLASIDEGQTDNGQTDNE